MYSAAFDVLIKKNWKFYRPQNPTLLTSAYFLNCLPLSTLGGEVSLRHLHLGRDLFALPPRVFGCVVFIHDHTPNTSKLVPHSIKEVFVDYSHTKKGYQFYFPNRRKYIIYADVTFIESTRYFSSTSSSTPPLEPSPSPIPTTSYFSSPADISHLPTLMDPTPLLSLSQPSPPTPLPDSPTSLLRMPPMTFPILISTPIYILLFANSSTSCSNLTPIALPSDDLHLDIALCKCKRSCTLHPISHFITYDNLHPCQSCFLPFSYYRVNIQVTLKSSKATSWEGNNGLRV